MNTIGDGPDTEPTPEDLQFISSLRATTPQPGDALRRRVHVVIRRGLEQKALRRRALLMGAGGAAMLALAVVAAFTGPG